MNQKRTNPDRVGLALGGGGARGMAYIGVFRVLQEEGLKPDLIAGTSIGALAAVMWVHSKDWRWVKSKTLDFLTNKRFRKYGMGLGLSGKEVKAPFLTRLGIWARRVIAAPRFLFGQGLFSAKGLQEAVDEALPDIRFEDLDTKVAAVALDLVSGREVTIDSGACRRACWISANLAGFFPAVRDDNRLLIDASSIASVPVGACRALGAGKVIGVDLRSPIPDIDSPRKIRSALDAVLRLGVIGSDRANQAQVDGADLVIRPDVGDVFWSDFRDFDRLEEAGAEATRAALPDLKRLFKTPDA